MVSGSTYSAQTQVVTTSATPQIVNLGFKTTSLLFRTPTTNTDNITIKFGTYDLLGGNLTIRAGESISFDITEILQLKIAMGKRLEDTDFITSLTITGAASAPVVWIDAIAV